MTVEKKKCTSNEQKHSYQREPCNELKSTAKIPPAVFESIQRKYLLAGQEINDRRMMVGIDDDADAKLARTHIFLYWLRLRLGGVHHPRQRSGNSSTNGTARQGRSCVGSGMLSIFDASMNERRSMVGHHRWRVCCFGKLTDMCRCTNSYADRCTCRWLSLLLLSVLLPSIPPGRHHRRTRRFPFQSNDV